MQHILSENWKNAYFKNYLINPIFSPKNCPLSKKKKQKTRFSRNDYLQILPAILRVRYFYS